MKRRCSSSQRIVFSLVGVLSMIGLSMVAHAAKPGAPGEIRTPEGRTIHSYVGKGEVGGVADFYCPHCHRFDGEGLPILEKEFGSKLDVTMVGYPVIPGKLPTAFDMYEQAKMMGKGNEMSGSSSGRSTRTRSAFWTARFAKR